MKVIAIKKINETENISPTLQIYDKSGISKQQRNGVETNEIPYSKIKLYQYIVLQNKIKYRKN